MWFAAAPDVTDIAAVLEFDRHAILAGQVWRLWTGHLVHYSAQHALIDLATALVAGLIATQSFGAPRVLCALALGAPFISIGLLLTAPDCAHYRGASGLAVLLAVMAGAGLWQQARGNHVAMVRAVLVLLAVALAVKIAAEAHGFSLGGSDLPPDVTVAWQAHLLGAVAGMAAAALPRARGRCVRRTM